MLKKINIVLPIVLLLVLLFVRINSDFIYIMSLTLVIGWLIPYITLLLTGIAMYKETHQKLSLASNILSIIMDIIIIVMLILLFNKSFIVIIIALLIIIILLTSIITIKIYTKPSRVLKRYLVKEEYDCNNTKCTKKIGDTTYNIYYKKGTITANNLDYGLETNDYSIELQIKSKKLNCTYTSNEKVVGEKIDSEFTYTSNCQDYIKEANKILEVYNDLLKESKVKISKLKK